MPTSTANTQQQSARNAAIAALAAQQLAQLWPQVDWTSPDAMSAVKTVYAAIVTKYGQAAASVAARFYDDTRASAGVRGAFIATPADPVPQVVTDKAVQSAFIGLDTPVDAPTTTSEMPVEQRVPARLDNALQRHVIQASRDTITENVAADPEKPRYVRVPMGPNPCAFCIMLASRDTAYVLGKSIDMTYKSAHSAQFVVGRGRDALRAGGTQPMGEKYHDHCDCEPVPIFGGGHPSEVSPKFNDYVDQYDKGTANAGTHRDTKKILAAMRQTSGLR